MPYLITITNQIGTFNVGFDDKESAIAYVQHIKDNHFIKGYDIKKITEGEKNEIIKQKTTSK